jgi:copper chaperone NosL
MFAFTRLPEEPRAIVAIYVNDMARARNWAHPEPGTWIDAHKAIFVIGSGKRSGMNEPEAVPFGDTSAAKAFVVENGGRMVRFDDMPTDYIFPGNDQADAAQG